MARPTPRTARTTDTESPLSGVLRCFCVSGPTALLGTALLLHCKEPQARLHGQVARIHEL